MVHNTYDTYGLLSIYNKVSIHQRHLHFLAAEAFKSVNNLNSQFMWDYLKIKFFTQDLRKGNTLHLPPTQSTLHGIISLLFRSSVLWNNLPREINRLSAKPTKWFHRLLPTNCFSLFDHFVGLALEGLRKASPKKKIRKGWKTEGAPSSSVFMCSL